ncbi:hypothetical protein A2U01_0106393, partial [Trifolium medium]|nr:hypothetical protein [Trifolium medium]
SDTTNTSSIYFPLPPAATATAAPLRQFQWRCSSTLSVSFSLVVTTSSSKSNVLPSAPF